MVQNIVVEDRSTDRVGESLLGRAKGFPLWLFQLPTLVVLAALVALFETAHLPGFDTAEMIHVDLARHIARGEGISASILFPNYVPKLPSPVSLLPPLYPAAIAGVSKLGMDVAVAARVVSILSFGLSVGLLWLLGSLMFGRSVGTMSALLLTVWPPVTAVASMALTENLFVLFILSSVLISTWLISLYQSPARSYLLAAAGGLAMAGAGLTRYPGMALIPVGAVALLINLRGRSWRERLALPAVWAFFASVPTGLLLARNFMVTGALIGARGFPDNRGFAFHAIYAMKTLTLDGARLIWRLAVVPEALGLNRRLLEVGVLGAVGLLCFTSLRNDQVRKSLFGAFRALVDSPGRRFIILIAAGYWAMMVVARSRMGGLELLNTRMMMPAYPLGLVCIVAFLDVFVTRMGFATRHFLTWLVALLCVSSIATVVLPGSLSAGGPRLRPGPAPEWVNWVATNTAPDAPIVGNRPIEFNFYLRRPVLSFQIYGVYGTGNRFERDCNVIAEHIAALGWEHPYLILHAEDGRFDTEFMGRSYGATIERLLKGAPSLPVRPIAHYPEFAVYKILDLAWKCNSG